MRSVEVAGVCWFVVLCLSAPALGQSLPVHAQEDGGPNRPVLATLAVRIRVPAHDPGCPRYRTTLLVDEGARAWRVAFSSEVDAGQVASVTGYAGVRSMLVLTCPRMTGYLLHGPFVWKASVSRLPVDPRPRRTIRLRPSSRSLQAARPALMVTDAAETAPWPLCGDGPPGIWECIGVPVDQSAVAIVVEGNGLAWQLFPPAAVPVQTGTLERARWGRLVRLVGVDRAVPGETTIGLLQPGRSGPRLRTTRVALVVDPLVVAVPLAPDMWWVVGVAPPVQRILEAKGPMVATRRVPLERLAEGPPTLPYHLHMTPALPASGIVVDAREVPVAAALVSVFELIERPAGAAQTSDTAIETRRLLADAVTGTDGRFALTGLGRGRYEIVATHPVKGRIMTEQVVDGRPLRVRLRPMPRLLGQVTAQDSPAVGVPVRVVPEQDTYRAATDPLPFVAPGTVTDHEGRFEIAAPPSGAGDIVVGGGGWPKVRRPYADAAELPATVDLGGIDLGVWSTMVLRLDRGSCRVSAAGPVGSLDVTLVDAVPEVDPFHHRLRVPEPGFWWLHVECGGTIRLTRPPFVRINESTVERRLDLEVGDRPP